MLNNNDVFHSLADLPGLARKRLPRMVFDFIEGGAGSETAVQRNVQALAHMTLLPRIGRDMSHVTRSLDWLGNRYTSPFGIAPLGLCGLVHPDADLMLARTAKKCGIPYILSATASTSVERIADALGEAPWFQLYAPQSAVHLERLIDRIDLAGCPVLVVTVDTAAPGRRLRDLRNGLRLPYRPGLASVIDVLRHPAWLRRQLAAPKIGFPNLPTPDSGADTLPFRTLMAWQTGGKLDWITLAALRARWPRRLVLKGVSSAADATQALALGIDAVTVSNHGGRQLDAAPAALTQLHELARAGIPRERVMFDSGIRSGEDVVKAVQSGAGMTFLGRPFLFALAVAGAQGAERVVDMLNEELETAMKLCGMHSITQV